MKVLCRIQIRNGRVQVLARTHTEAMQMLHTCCASTSVASCSSVRPSWPAKPTFVFSTRNGLCTHDNQRRTQTVGHFFFSPFHCRSRNLNALTPTSGIGPMHPRRYMQGSPSCNLTGTRDNAAKQLNRNLPAPSGPLKSTRAANYIYIYTYIFLSNTQKGGGGEKKTHTHIQKLA